MANERNLAAEGGVAFFEQRVDAIALREDSLDDVFAVGGGLIEKDVEGKVGHERADGRDALYGNICEGGVFIFVARGARREIGFTRVGTEGLLGEVEEVTPA